MQERVSAENREKRGMEGGFCGGRGEWREGFVEGKGCGGRVLWRKRVVEGGFRYISNSEERHFF